MVEIKSLVKTYKTGDEEVRAIDDISLNIKQGEIVAISGASGSGKTTLLNLIGTLDNITSGDIIINEHSIASMNEKEKTNYRKLNLGFIFQSYNLIPVLSALENVELAFQPLSKQELAEIGISDTKLAAKEALKAVGLEGYEERRPGQLSGGQQQRVSIARAIVRKPKILLADEPTANLDSKNSLLILALLSKLSHENKITVIYSSHDQEVLKNVERVIILKDGKLVEDKKC
ncbi:ABC transporter ATP-binding protein [Spirochaetales bacterium NM-380-WT-3C1]|uniref:ABC transporter ATP-binding protein n=1 Tax=Bullifex porci TaxID=2606638 RepID=A0A7X2PC81_9SPIO|nr:ABC transporter ATP-binding protein [Bullifex porci]MSU06192.1 ABC transporter ATP-binding protein [Bullifex porci]